jgi:predicted MFS family arabinose efflux permease
MQDSITTAQLNGNVAILTTTRLVVNTSIRMVYPFLAVFAAGMHVEIGLISLALAISMATSAVGPFLAPIADRHGRKTGMLIGLAIYLAGTLLAGIWPSYATFFLSILLGNLGNNVFVPALQAYLGDHTPYEKRGLYLAIAEVPWALSFILLIPLVGLIIEKSAWYTPFWYLSGLVAVMIVLIAWLIPAEQTEPAETKTMFGEIKKVLTYGPALIGMAMGLLIIVGNEVVNMVFGVWMQDSFNLQIAALGAASAIIGFSELAGEGITAFLADRLGKERFVAIGLGLSSLFVLTLPWLGKSVAGALIWLFLFYFTFELVIVSALPLMTEVMPQARATVMALFIAALSMGRAIGDVIAPILYRGGFWFNAGACVLFNILAGIALSRIKFPKRTQAEQSGSIQ